MQEGELVFLKPEDECFYKYRQWSCTWAVQKSGEYEQDMKYQRVLMLLPKSGLLKGVKEVAALFQHDLTQHGQ